LKSSELPVCDNSKLKSIPYLAADFNWKEWMCDFTEVRNIAGSFPQAVLTILNYRQLPGLLLNEPSQIQAMVPS
jgi:hypothetical protein